MLQRDHPSLTAQGGWMVSPSMIGQVDHVVGTGAFEMIEWRPGDGAPYERFENYWRAKKESPPRRPRSR